jgi:hypothetical protein
MFPRGGRLQLHVCALQVKLLKCLVDNIVVDISFDTLGGLCTVAFLESIDRHIGEKHLFKRSVILVRTPLACIVPLGCRMRLKACWRQLARACCHA